MLADTRLADVGVLIDYLHRLQLRAAVWRRMVLAAEPDVAIAVGFADLSGYTKLSATLDATSLSELVGRWEAVAYDTIAANGARVVKTIGDEVMYVGLTARDASTASLALRDAAAAEALPPLRIGLAAGPVVVARRRLLRSGRQPREPAHRDRGARRGAGAGRAARRAARRAAVRPCGGSRGARSSCAASARWRSLRSSAAGSVLRVTEERLSLLQVHAHPDDEASKGAGTTAKYAAEGVHNVLVCCTGGEAGDILNPAVEHPGSPEAMYELRMAELARERARARLRRRCTCSATATAACPTPRTNARPDNFANAPLDEAVGRLVHDHPRRASAGDHHLPRRPHFYPHPDHIRVHEISVPAFDLAGDPEAYPDAGEPWQPLKLYYVSWSIARVKALHQAYLDRGEESAYASWFERGFDKDRTDDFTTLIDVGDFLAKRRGVVARAPHAGRPRTATGCVCPTTSSARCSRGRSTRSRGRSSTTTCPRASTKTICSPACASACSRAVADAR